ncbi:hypothetical protein ACFX1Q_010666 [Malus domestica]
MALTALIGGCGTLPSLRFLGTRRQLFDESSTTDRKPEEPETRYTGTGNGSEPNKPVEPADGEIGLAEQSSNPAVEDSCNGSSDSMAKEAAGMESEKGNSGELRESMAESKGGEEGMKESRERCRGYAEDLRVSVFGVALLCGNLMKVNL